MVPMELAKDPAPMNLSLAGCGFLGIYHVGVASCIQKYAPHLIENGISGASAGSLVAAGMLCGLPLGTVHQFRATCSIKSRISSTSTQ
jgi:predicted acylesterase/phospholipase RssA